MNRLAILALLMFSSTAFAHGYGHGHHGPHYNWVAPVIIGSAIGYGIGRYYNPPVVVQQSPVYVETQPTYNCTEWHEVIQPDGRITRERTCYQR
jgi:hypothetical protein